jgi:hypothetical protein
VIGSRFPLPAALACCLVASGGFAAASQAQPGVEERTVTSERRDRPPSELWDEFPLEEPARAPASPRSDRVSRSREPVTVESGDSAVSTNQQLLLLAAIAALALLGPAVLFGPAVFALVRPRRRRPARAGVVAAAPPAYRPPRRRAPVPSTDRSAYIAQQRALLLAAMRGPGTTQARVHAARAIAIEALELNMVSSENAERRLEPVEENIVRPAVEGHNAGETAAEHESTLPDVTQLGDRVAAVLRAAEEAAEQIRTDAQAAAEQVTRQAEQEAKARLEESRREAVRVLSDAETQARASREAAEAMVQRIQESARSLEEEVREQERMIRGRMQRYLAGLRDASGQIEAVLHETERDAPPLVEALNVERANHQG